MYAPGEKASGRLAAGGQETVNAKTTLILLMAFKRAMMLFLKEGVDRAIQELRSDESVDTPVASQGRPTQVSSRDVM